MTLGILIVVLLAIGGAGYVAGRKRALRLVGGDIRRLHSLAGYYGQAVFLFAFVPALFVVIAWLVAQPLVVEHRVAGLVTPAEIAEGSSLGLVMADVRRIAGGIDAAVLAGVLDEDRVAAMAADPKGLRESLGNVGIVLVTDLKAGVFAAAQEYRRLSNAGRVEMSLAAIAVALLGGALIWLRIGPEFRARNVSETAVKGLLILSASIAVVTTVGIILSLVFETWGFFTRYPFQDFFFNLTWNPQFRGGSDLGILPLLWGTLYVSVVSLVVAVPVGLLAAVYLAEYASRRMRSLAKPAIELLAGIPTIVYGLFALITVGPLLRDWFAQPLGLGSSSSSVITAGLVMGIMLIPFVSSLSDDVINAVPQAMRDGSYGLGATRSETVRKVILPAALPGIVGAVLLAASRAIGETMIVVMGAGAAAKLSLNPFEAMTTITVKIVSQLTGDTEFASPETLVAFALGLTLFVLTLGLNILALYVVRKYREQYE